VTGCVGHVPSKVSGSTDLQTKSRVVGLRLDRLLLLLLLFKMALRSIFPICISSVGHGKHGDTRTGRSKTSVDLLLHLMVGRLAPVHQIYPSSRAVRWHSTKRFIYCSRRPSTVARSLARLLRVFHNSSPQIAAS